MAANTRKKSAQKPVFEISADYADGFVGMEFSKLSLTDKQVSNLKRLFKAAAKEAGVKLKHLNVDLEKSNFRGGTFKRSDITFQGGPGPFRKKAFNNMVGILEKKIARAPSLRVSAGLMTKAL